MKLHNAIQVEREPADFAGVPIDRLASCSGCATLVPAAPFPDAWAGADVLNHTPSPFGRIGHVPGRPSIFLRRGIGGKTLNKQGFAQISHFANRDLDSSRGLVRLLPKTASKKESQPICEPETGSLPSLPAADLQPAATRSNNKRSSGQGRVLRARLSSTAIFSVARLLARRPMSPIAGNTHRAATKRASSAIAPIEILHPITAACRGGVFVAIAPGSVPGGQEPEGTTHVQ